MNDKPVSLIEFKVEKWVEKAVETTHTHLNKFDGEREMILDCLQKSHDENDAGEKTEKFEECFAAISSLLKKENSPRNLLLSAQASIAPIILDLIQDNPIEGKELLIESIKSNIIAALSIIKQENGRKDSTELSSVLSKYFEFGDSLTFLLMVLMLKGYKDLEAANQKLETTNEKLEENNLRMQQLMDEYRHTLIKTILPGRLLNVANSLKTHALGDTTIKEACLNLDDAYNDERFILQESDLLLSRYIKQKDEDFQCKIGMSRADAGADNNDKITDVIFLWDYALHRATALFLKDRDDYWEKARERFFDKRQMGLEKLKNLQDDFTDFVSLGNMRASEWVKKYLYPINSVFSENWRNVRVERYGYAETLVYKYFYELWLNFYKYSNLDYVEIRFYDAFINEKKYLLSEWKNPYTNRQSELSTRKGLESIRSDLKALNGTKKNEKSLLIRDNEKDKIFSVQLIIKEDLLLFQPYSLPEEIE